MDLIFKNADVFINNKFEKRDIKITQKRVELSFDGDIKNDDIVYDFSGCVIIPGLMDAHVHLREPGFSYKETIKSGTMACARGGYTTVCSMPNLNPVPDSIENLKEQTDIIKRDAKINVYPYASLTVGEMGEELSDIDGLHDKVIGFSDDGRGVQSAELMEKAMLLIKKYDGIISAHCEENSLLNGGYIHDGEYAKKHSHKGICSESEYLPIKRDIELIKKTGCKYHVCHISAKESVEAIRQAKKEGIDITCETGPHYLVLCDKDLQEDGRFKMNPPLRSEDDKKALIDGILDGTIDMIATDHAPHSAEEKSKGLEKSNMGVVGIETAFSVMYTHFVKTGLITLERLIELMSINPCKRFGVENGIKEKEIANLTIFDLNKEYEVNSNDFLSKGKSTPFEGMKVFAKCLLTIANGNIAFEDASERKIKWTKAFML